MTPRIIGHTEVLCRETRQCQQCLEVSSAPHLLRGLRAGGLGGADMHAEPLLVGAHPGDLIVALSEVSARVPAREEVILVTRVTLDPFS